MYDADFWWICPAFLIPASLIWVGLDCLLDRLEIAEKLSKRYNWNTRILKRWIHRITCIISYLLTFVVFLVVMLFTKIDLTKFL